MMRKEKLVYCGSDMIDHDLNEYAGTYEYPTGGEFISSNNCRRCGVRRCPNHPDYTKPNTQELERLLAESTRHRTFSF